MLAQAAGNPLALIELSKAIAADPGAARRWAAEPLPLTGRLTGIMAARFSGLPEPTRAALLLAAVADSPDLMTAALPGLSADALVPAEVAGLIRVGPTGPAVQPPARPVDGLSCRPVRRARRGAPDGSRPRSATSPTATRGIWRPRHSNPTSRWPPCSSRARPLLSAAAASRRRPVPWNAPASSARPSGTSARRVLAAADLAVAAGEADWVRDLSAEVLTLAPGPGDAHTKPG